MHIEDRIKKIDYESEIERIKGYQKLYPDEDYSVYANEYIARCEEIVWLMKCRDKWAELYDTVCDHINVYESNVCYHCYKAIEEALIELEKEEA